MSSQERPETDSGVLLNTALRNARHPEAYHGALSRALSAFQERSEAVAARDQVKLACGEGCALCCSLRVDVIAPEVFLIAEHLRRHFSAESMAALTERLEAHAAQVTRMTPFEHATRNMPCPLLEGYRCSVYAVRPHTCRRCHSTDLSACEYIHDHPEDLEFPGAHDPGLSRELGETMQAHFDAYHAESLDLTVYELGSALSEALKSPAAWRRWRDGKRAFLGASITPTAGSDSD
jgi:Fe-S-cluster containining protein